MWIPDHDKIWVVWRKKGDRRKNTYQNQTEKVPWYHTPHTNTRQLNESPIRSKLWEVAKGSTVTNSNKGPSPKLCKNNKRNMDTIDGAKASPKTNLVSNGNALRGVWVPNVARWESSEPLSEVEELRKYPAYPAYHSLWPLEDETTNISPFSVIEQCRPHDNHFSPLQANEEFHINSYLCEVTTTIVKTCRLQIPWQ